ncbi:MAG: hypothetical protein ABI759_28570 [Candidatus Solibacter sp.]
MPNAFRLLFDGEPATDDLYTQLASLEVEESLDMPGAFELELPVSRTTGGDLSFINDSQFQPYVNVAVVAFAESQPAECIFDGFVLSSKLHVESGAFNSKMHIWGQDASWLMNLEEKVKEWTDVTDGDVANSIFGDYGFSAASENTSGDSASHTEDVNTLMQRATDIQFLRLLARRGGKFVRVACGSEPGVRTGYFVRPTVDGDPVITLQVTDLNECNVDGVDFEWDVTRPSEVAANQALIASDDEDGASGDASDSGLAPMADRDLAAFAGRSNKALLTAAASDAGDLSMRAQAMLGDAGWFARCEGQTDLARLKKVMRAGTVVAVAGAGSIHSGNYLVWSVRHTIDQENHTMKFSLVRNAQGPLAAGGGGLF